jgi:hypothetical protein
MGEKLWLRRFPKLLYNFQWGFLCADKAPRMEQGFIVKWERSSGPQFGNYLTPKALHGIKTKIVIFRCTLHQKLKLYIALDQKALGHSTLVIKHKHIM